MIKSAFAALAASSTLFAGAAFAGPYVNVETNAGWTGDDYTGATCLLYTSPSPRDRTRSRMPSSA